MTTFESCVRQAAQSLKVDLGGGVEPLAALDYRTEQRVKTAAWKTFVSELRIGNARVDALAEAPRPRGYRTTSRRRLGVWDGKVLLTHGDGTPSREPSTLEPERHGQIYTRLEALFAKQHISVVEAVSHVILRGTYDEHVLIVNVRELDARIVRTVRKVCDTLCEEFPAIEHVWIYHDPKGSRYYLDIERPATGVGSKKLRGAAAWKQDVGAMTYQVGVFSFSQINLAMLPDLVRTVADHAQAQPEDVLFDLYSGYGLFGAAMGGSVRHVVTCDADASTVDNARYNVRRSGGHVSAVQQIFTEPQDVGRLGRKLDKSVPRQLVDAPRLMVLDPPRSATPPGMIRELARMLEPRRVVEIFCGPEEIPRSLREWRAAGYEPERITPLDLFPGTMGLEVVVTLMPANEDEVRRDVPAPRRTPRGSGGPRRR
jgi:tRNA/tmRNA/rRNA uracil-C5-methylase (TrmA/RlmC/RlmD family)